MKKKVYGFIFSVLLMTMLSACVCALAKDTTDYTFNKDEIIDFCVYNTWGQKLVECDKATISNIRMIVDVSGFSGDPVTLKLYNRESTTWGWWTSEPQVIDGDGKYAFDIDISEGAYDAETLCTIYLKDVKCAASADEDPVDGKDEKSSGAACHIVLDTIKFNTDLSTPAIATPTPSPTPEPTAAPAPDTLTDVAADTSSSQPADIVPAGAPSAASSGTRTVLIIVLIVLWVIAAAVIIIGIITTSKKKK